MPPPGVSVLRPASRDPQGVDADAASVWLGFRGGDRSAAASLFDQHARRLEGILFRILGIDDEIPDLLQEVFVRAFESADRLRDPQALTDWLNRIAVCCAMDCLRRRHRRKWLLFFAPKELPDVEFYEIDDESREALRAVYAILDTFPPEEQVAFALRVFEDCDLAAIASMCGCSLATAKRRIARAQRRFDEAVQAHNGLADFTAKWGGDSDD